MKARDVGVAYYNYFQARRRTPPDFDRLVPVEFDHWIVSEARSIERDLLPLVRDYDFKAKEADRFRRRGRWRPEGTPVDPASTQQRKRQVHDPP